MKKLLILMSMILISCGSTEKEVSTDEWNIDKDLENAFWGAVNALEEHGTNLRKLQSEHIEVVFVDEIEGASSLTVAQAQKIFGDGIRIAVIRDKWTKATTKEEQLQNKITMLHELGHDYFNLKGHYSNGWDIMNSSNTPNKKVSIEEVSNSIDRMLIDGRRVYDSLALTKRF